MSQRLFHKFLPYYFPNFDVKDLPTSVDWRDAGIVTAVKDQASCGSCWAFAATAVMESHVAKASGKLFELSTQQIAMCSPNPEQCGGTGGCEGATEDLAFDYVSKSNGVYLESEIPYKSGSGKDYPCEETLETKASATITGFVRLPLNDYASLMNAIATIGPLTVSVDATTWSSYDSGIFNGCNQVNPDSNHAVTLVGYGEENGQKYWLVRNSWSESYGENGYIRVLRSDDDDTNCGMDITPEHGSACKGDHTPVKVCGTCGIISDSSYPLGAKAL